MKAGKGPAQVGDLNISFRCGREEREFHSVRVEAGRPIRDDKGLIQVPWRAQSASEKNV